MKIKLFLTMIMGLCATAVCAQTWPYQDARTFSKHHLLSLHQLQRFC